MTRLEQLREKLAGSMKGSEPKPGLKERVDALRAEIARLEAENG